MKKRYMNYDELPAFLNAEDIAQLLGISRAGAYEMMHAEGFPLLQSQKKRMITPKDKFLKWIDELAGIVAIRHCGGTVTTAAIDNLQFQAPAYTGDMIVLQGMVTYVGRTSMEVRVDTYREALNGTREMINRAYIDMVCINCKGEPTEVPELLLETEEQRQEYEAAKKRKQIRKQRRQEGF